MSAAANSSTIAARATMETAPGRALFSPTDGFLLPRDPFFKAPARRAEGRGRHRHPMPPATAHRYRYLRLLGWDRARCRDRAQHDEACRQDPEQRHDRDDEA